jgi:hypothetical protein
LFVSGRVVQVVCVHFSLWLQPADLFPRLLLLHAAHLHHVIVYALPGDDLARAPAAAAWFARQSQ